MPNSTGYGPSKSALNNLAESLYFDFGRFNVRVSLVSPGFKKTPMTDKNDFKMPFLKTTEYAAEKIYDGLIKKNNFEIHFPKELTLTLKFFSILPYRIYFYLVKKLTKFQKNNYSLTKKTVNSATLKPNFVIFALLIATFSSCINIQSSKVIFISFPFTGTNKTYSNLKAGP